MGQYYKAVNLDKKQYIHAHQIGGGLKLMEGAYGCALTLLCASGNGRGGGDFHGKRELVGSWAGDRVVIAGDYDDPGKWIDEKDLEDWELENKLNPESEQATERPNLYQYVDKHYTNISEGVKAMLAIASF